MKMEFVIVTGLSGAGKTRAMHALEDIGFFCVDNLPAQLIPTFYELCLNSRESRQKVVVVTDARGGRCSPPFSRCWTPCGSMGWSTKSCF